MIYTIMDIETTGFDTVRDEILEVGYMQINQNLEILRSGVLFFYKPEFKVETPAQAVHHLKREMLEEHAGEFYGNLVRLYTLVHQSIFIGKNSNKFDVPFILNFMMKHTGILAPVPRGTVDLQEIYAPRFQEAYKKEHGVATKKKGTLSELIEMIGYSQERVQEEFCQAIPDTYGREQAHSGLYDVYETFLLLKHAIAESWVSIYNSTGKSRAELKNDRAIELVTGDGNVDIRDWMQAWQDVVAFKKIDITQVASFRGYRLEDTFNRQNMLYVQLTEDGNHVKRKGYVVWGDQYCDVRELLYWLLDCYLFEQDDVFLGLMKVLLRIVKYDEKSLRFQMKKRISFDLAKHDNSFVSLLVDITENSAKMPTQWDSEDNLALFAKDQKAFWTKVFPDTAELFYALANGYVDTDVESLNGFKSLIWQRRSL